MNPQLIKSFAAAAEVGAYLIAKFAAPTTAATVTAAAAATDPLLGVTDSMGAKSDGMLDVVLSGLAELRLGGTVAAGDPLTADADGKAVKCDPAAGTTAHTIAFALSPGVEGDIIPVHVVPGSITKPAA